MASSIPPITGTGTHTGPATGANAGTLPYLSASQSSALLRSAAGISCELMGRSFPAIMELVRDSIATRWDFDVGSPIVQRLLAAKGDEFCQGFAHHLPLKQNEAFERLLAGRQQGMAAGELDASTLELVVDSDNRGETIAGRAARRMMGLVEQPMRDLELVVGYLCGRDYVASADNPYGPSVYVPALLEAAIDVGLHAEAWVFFLTAFEADLGAEIARVSQSLLDHFRTHGFEVRAIRRALSARRMPAPARPSTTGAALAAGVGGAWAGLGQALMQGAQAGMAGAGGTGAGTGTGGGDAGMVLKDLLARLQTNVAGGPAAPAMPTAQSPVAPMLLEALGELQTLGMQGMQGAMFASTSAGSISAWREHLVSQSTRTVDKLTIEIVGMMFDHVLRDEQVPAEIKSLLSRLQFPVLKAALLDAAFFASSSHPARRLIDRIAAASIGWEPYGDDNEKFRTEVDRVVREVMERFDRDMAVFEAVLAEFEAFLGDIAPRETDPIARAKRALEEAEKREILIINTTIQVRRVFERVEIENWLREFLIGPWVQVLVQANLRDDQTKGYSRSFREVIHEIVWSVQPKATAEERRRLVELIPELTRIIRDGLSLIRFPQREVEELLQNLMAAHAYAVKPTDQATYIRNALQSSEVRARMDSLQLTSSFPLTAVPGGVRVPTGAVMRAAADHHVDLTVPAALTDVGLIDKTEQARMDHDLSQWTRGSWFELRQGEEFIKARLRWISPLRTLFMFSSGTENRAHVMSPDLIQAYLRRGFIRPLEGTPLTERAAQGVVTDFATIPGRAEAMASRVAVAE